MRLGTATNGKVSIEFVRGTDIDGYNDFRLINQSGVFRLQYEDDELIYGNTGTDLISASTTQISLGKNTEITGNVGIGTASSSYNLDIFNQSTARIRLQSSSDFGATTSIEFRKGITLDTSSDYRLINDNATFKLQYENNDFPYGNNNNIMTWNRVDVVNYIQTRFSANVGINTDPHATYKLDVNGTINATAVRGNGAELTDLNAGNITTGTINLDRITLTANKLYESFNTTNFAVIDNKIDLPPNYSFSITDYDSQTLFNPSAERKYKGKMTANYDDRNGVYKLITTDNRTDNVAVLNYRVGDKISIRNTANTVNDYLLESGSKYFNSLLLFKRPTNRPLNWAVNDAFSVLMYEWFSSDGLEGRPEARVRTPTNRYFPFTTVMTFIIEAGFNYYLAKLYNQTETSGGSVIVVQSPYGDDTNDFNRAFGAGQTFKLQITGSSAADDYIPRDYISADIGIASDRRLGGVKKGRGVAIDATTGELSSTPVSLDLINSMNTAHFTNNLTTGKIDISSSYIAPNATKLATARNIAGVSFDGTINIDIPYSGLTSVPTTWNVSQIPDLGAGKITSGTFSADRIPDLGAGKITSGTFSTDRIPDLGAGKITSGTFSADRIPNLDTGKITTGTFDVARIPDLGTAKITSGIFDVLRIPDLGTAKITSGTFSTDRIPNLDTGKITTGTFDVARIPDLGTAKITSGIFDVARIPDLGTAKITSGIFDVLRIPDLATSKITSGTFDVLRIPDLATSKITSGTFVDARIPNLDTAKITTGTFVDARIPNLDTAKITTGTFVDARIPSLAISKITGLQTALDAKQATLTAGTGINISGNVISTYASSWFNVTSGSGMFQIVYNDIYFDLAKVGIGSSAMPNALFHIRGNATNAGSMIVEHQSSTPNIELVRGLTSSSTDFNWRMLNDNAFKIQNKTSTNAYADRFVISSAGNVGIATTPHATYRLDVNGTINATSVLVGGSTISGSKWTTATDTTRIFYNTGNVGIGTTNPVNILQVGGGGRLRISNNNTDQTIIGCDDVDSATNTRIIFSGSARTGINGTIDYVATTTGSHRFYTTNTAIERMRIASNGNVGVGTTDTNTYKLNVNGTTLLNGQVYIGTSAASSTIFMGGGAAGDTGYDHSVIETRNYAGTEKTEMLLFKGNDWNEGPGPDRIRLRAGQIVFDTYSTGTVDRTAENIRMTIGSNGNITMTNELYVNNTTNLRNTVIYSGNESSGIALYFATPFTGTPFGATKSAIIAEPITNHSRHHLAFCMNRVNSNSVNVGTGDVYFRMHQDNYIDVYKQLRVYNEIFGGFFSVSMTDTDYLCVQGNYGANNAYGERWIKVAFGSFTAFHRCYTDDELYNNETDESIDLFKNNYMGRVVIATGKIKTDFTRTTPAPNEETDVEEDKAPKENNEWYSEIDKDGIAIEDAIPIVALSRKKKDKRVFGVLGAPKRSTNNKNRLIVNSIGEGAICVSNTNGNIENGDLLQSSDLLGYAEKQDDDIIRSYTIGKATIDCDFELDSPYYQCHEIENGVRVAFIACSYHCG
jgi:hypothetical protein